jgi:hypothetical protein
MIVKYFPVRRKWKQKTIERNFKARAGEFPVEKHHLRSDSEILDQQAKSECLKTSKGKILHLNI